jgi:hypothetical protein
MLWRNYIIQYTFISSHPPWEEPIPIQNTIPHST